MHYIGAGLILLLITAAGVWSGRQVKSAGDFTNGGRKAGAGIVAGSIIGSLVGGASTIGTAQLAFTSGFSAWWFTLGGGLGCLTMALFFAKPLYNSGISTLPQVFAREYGRPVATAATLLTSIGNFLTIAAQVLSGVALITAVSSITAMPAALITVVLMLVYVVFGGVWGAGLVGIIKTVLLYIGVGACGILALRIQGGVSGFMEVLPAEQYFNLLSRGASVDLGAGLSLILGVLTTQAYIQAVVSARSLKLSRSGVFACALVIPIIGIAGIFIGMYMKVHHPDIASASALPMFVLEHAPPVVAGAILATLLVTLVGTGAGISLGLSSMITNDIYRVYVNNRAGDKKMLTVTRLVIVAILAGAVLLTGGNMGSTILNWSYMSMGLRGAVGFIPLCTALFLPGRIPKNYVMASMIAAPVGVLAGKALLPPTIDSLFAGVGVSLLIMAAGLWAGRHRVPGHNVFYINERMIYMYHNKITVVAIDEQYGSGGAAIGSAIAENMGVPCYGPMEITQKASEISGIEVRLLRKYLEKKVRGAYDFGADEYDRVKLPPAGDFVKAMDKATQALAESGSCVLVNSHASLLYTDRDDILKIFVHAGDKQRAREVPERDQLDDGAAMELLKRIDRQRQSYYHALSKKWGDATAYHLAVNTSGMTSAEAAGRILDFLREKREKASRTA